MKNTSDFLAVDLGASNGRVFKGSWNGKKFQLREMHRFANSSINVGGHLHWDVLRLWSEIKNGMSCYSRESRRAPAGIGVDAWGVDFALLDSAGRLLGNPYTYRDRRTDGIPAAVFAQIPEHEIFEETGVQSWQINTLFQIFSMVQNKDPQLKFAGTMLMIPDLFNFWLSGEKAVEYTVGSTSQMLCSERTEWAYKLLRRLRIQPDFLPSLTEPGTVLGPIRREIAKEINFPTAPPIWAVAAHDTASTVAAIPGMDLDAAFISSGTLSIMGVEIAEPITNAQARHLGFSNERGFTGSVLLLCNINALWLLQECRRHWSLQGHFYTWTGLVKLAGRAKPFRSLIPPDSPDFTAPHDMLAAIRKFCRQTRQPLPDSAGTFVRCCLESLSLRYRQALESLTALTGRRLSKLRVVGGGSRNRMLCQFTANATNRTVVTGPVEASVLGNVLVQAIATGHIKNLTQGREIISTCIDQSVFEPYKIDEWDEAFQRFQKLCPAPLTALNAISD
jgi:rhamnulokinase